MIKNIDYKNSCMHVCILFMNELFSRKCNGLFLGFKFNADQRPACVTRTSVHIQVHAGHCRSEQKRPSKSKQNNTIAAWN